MSTRRQFVKNSLLTAGGLFTAGVTAKAYRLEQSAHFDQFAVAHWGITDLRFPPDFDLKIGFATDFHVGCTTVSLEKLATIVQQINALDVDFIFLGGDYQNNTFFNSNILKPTPTPLEIAHVFGDLRDKDKTFGVLGNHDWGASGAAMLYALQDNGIQMLENNFATLEHKGMHIRLMGLPDYKERYETDALTIRRDMSDMLGQSHLQPTIVLGHDPFLHHFVPADVVVALYGHTHGWQLPIWGCALPLTKPTDGIPDHWGRGFIHDDGFAPLVVSSGIGHSTIPLKSTPNELVIVTINPSRQAALKP